MVLVVVEAEKKLFKITSLAAEVSERENEVHLNHDFATIRPKPKTHNTYRRRRLLGIFRFQSQGPSPLSIAEQL